jgi:hypothetical protein
MAIESCPDGTACGTSAVITGASIADELLDFFGVILMFKVAVVGSVIEE